MQQKLSYKDLGIKFITGLIIFSFLAPFLFLAIPTKKASAIGMVVVPDPFWEAKIILQTASTATSAGVATKEEVWRTVVKELAMIFARKLLNKMTQNIVNWANRGFSGNPLFVENPSSFFKDIAKSEIHTLVDRYGYDKLKFPFGKQFALNTIAAYRNQIDTNATYSLSKIINDPVVLDGYQNDFSVGGWNTFLLNTQYPQNNYVGFTLKATDKINSKLQDTVMTKAQTVQDTLQKGQGFLSPKLCMDKGTKYNNMKNEFLQPRFDQAAYNKAHPIDDCYSMGDVLGASSESVAACVERWNADRNKAAADWLNTQGCKNLVVTTPGGVVGAQVSRALQSKIGQGELAAAMGNSIANALAAVLDNLIAKGLNSLYSTKEEEVAGRSTLPAGAGGGGSGEGGDSCTGGNTKCVCAKGVSDYAPYENAVNAAENQVYPSGLPAGVTARQAQTAVCGAYAGPGKCLPATQEDELYISGLPAPYVTVSIDFLIGGAPYTGLSSNAVAACEEGEQVGIDGTVGSPMTQKIITSLACRDTCIASGGYSIGISSCDISCGYAGASSGPNMDASECQNKCLQGGDSGNAVFRNKCQTGCIAAYNAALNNSTPPPGDTPPPDGNGNQ